MDFSAICRTCLRSNDLNPIFHNSEECNVKRYSIAVYLTTGLKVEPDDGMPQQMCTKCINHLNNSLKFRKRSREAETELLNMKQHKLDNDSETSIVEHNLNYADKNTSKLKHKTKLPANTIELRIMPENVEVDKQMEIKTEYTDCKVLKDQVNINDLNYDEENANELKHETILTNLKLDVKPNVEMQSQTEILTKYTDYEVLEEQYDDDDDNKPLKHLIDAENGVNDVKYVSESDGYVEEDVLVFVRDTKKKTSKRSAKNTKSVSKQSRVTCQLCQKELSPRSVAGHMARSHPGVGGQWPGLRCPYCKTNYESKEALVEHAASCPAKKKRKACQSSRELLECDVCHKTMQKGSLRMHVAIKHAGLGPVCEHCGRRFGNKFRLDEHYRAKHGYEKHKCRYCDFQSAGTMAMRNHERRHRGEKPFVCETCGAKFHAAYLLAQHKQSHRTERLVKCDLCPASFKANNSLHMHKLTCHSTSLFKCTMCPRAYSCRHYAVKHLRHVHDYRGPVPPLQRVDPPARV